MLLKINQLYFSHSPEKRLFHNFNLKVEAGKIIALAGESGCGKSSIAQALLGGVREGAGLVDGGDAGLLEREGGR